MLAAADQAVTGGSFQERRADRGPLGHDLPRQEGRQDGASYKIVLSPEGDVLRKVREQRAEIEIPLAD